jgi:hypothetical protein
LHKLWSNLVFFINSKKIKFWPKKGFEESCFWRLNIMILQLLSFSLWIFERIVFDELMNILRWLGLGEEFKEWNWMARFKKGWSESILRILPLQNFRSQTYHQFGIFWRPNKFLGEMSKDQLHLRKIQNSWQMSIDIM